MMENSVVTGSDTLQSEVGTLRTVILKPAHAAFRDGATIDAQWKDLGYLAPPNFDNALREYSRFRRVFAELGCQLFELPEDPETTLDSIYVRDAAVVCDRGVILCSMGKSQRRSEPAAIEKAVSQQGIVIAGQITGKGRLEGGDVVWLDPQTIAAGISYRTNLDGVAQLREILGSCAREVIEVPLPHFKGPQDVFHLMSILSPIDTDLLLVFSPLLPIPFRNDLLERGFQLVEVPEEEFESMGCNVLTLAPRRCLALAGNPVTRSRLEAAGAEVIVYEGEEISCKGAGGPTCLTRPTARAAV